MKVRRGLDVYQLQFSPFVHTVRVCVHLSVLYTQNGFSLRGEKKVLKELGMLKE